MKNRELTVYAAGSLRYAFSNLLAAFSERFDVSVNVTFAPAGLLRQRIEAGERVDVFASANAEHPQRLIGQGLACSTRHFINNSLCIVMRNHFELTSRPWLEALADERFILATSTPGCDPSGDYSIRLFELIERFHPGVGEKLRRKARHLVGGEMQSTLPKNVLPAAYLIESGQADIFISYSNYAARLSEFPYLHIMNVPAPYSVDAQYWLAAMASALPETDVLADFIMSPDGQNYLIANGLQAVDQQMS